MTPEAGTPEAGRRQILGMDIDAVSMAQALRRCTDAVDRSVPIRIGVLNAAKLVSVQKDSRLRASIAGCELVIADGLAVVWASRLLRRPLPARVAGIDLFERLLAAASDRGDSVYLLGGTEQVIGQVVNELRRSYPGIRIAGSRNGYFEGPEESGIANSIRNANPDMLFVGISSPKKEFFLERWGAMTGARVCHGVGGSFDVLAGKVSRAPVSWQRLGLEWLFRVFQEPRRMWKRYLTTNSAFLWLLARALIGLPRQPR